METETDALKTYIQLLRTARALEKIAKQDVACYGLNITEFSVLELLYHKGPHPIQRIKERILIASSSTTYVIDQLMKKEFVVRRIDQEDRRVTNVHITLKGRALMDEIFPIHAKTITQSFDSLTKKELLQLQELIKRIEE